MGTISLSIPQTGQPNSTEDPKIATDFTTIQTWANGNIDVSNLSSAAQTTLLGGSWQSLTLGTNIGAFGAGTFSPQARLENDIVRLRGQATNTVSKASGFLWATLPVGLRPSSQVDLCVMVAANPILVCDLTIATNGQMTVGVSGSGTVGSNSILLLDGLTFTVS